MCSKEQQCRGSRRGDLVLFSSFGVKLEDKCILHSFHDCLRTPLLGKSCRHSECTRRSPPWAGDEPGAPRAALGLREDFLREVPSKFNLRASRSQPEDKEARLGRRHGSQGPAVVGARALGQPSQFDVALAAGVAEVPGGHGGRVRR